MRMVYLISLLFLSNPLAEVAAATRVAVIPTIHGYHKDHSEYSYQDLYNLVASFDPDYVGVELRAEDIGADPDYLKSNYPQEMIHLGRLYGNRAFGFDWLGSSIAGKAIPEDYWSNLAAIQLQKELAEDKITQQRKPAELVELQAKQLELISKDAPVSLFDGRYGRLCLLIDELEKAWLGATKYNEYLDFNHSRDRHIVENIARFADTHGDATIVIVAGADHVPVVLADLQDKTETDIEFLPVEWTKETPR